MTPCQIAVITALCKAGHSNNFISQQTGVSLRSVQRWSAKFKASPDGNVTLHEKIPGRPRKTSARILNIIKRQVEVCPTITSRQLKEQNPELLGNVCTRTVRRRLHEDLGYTRCAARKKPLVTYKQRMNRLQFARRHMHWNMRQWKNVICSDESMFQVSDNCTKTVYRRKDSDPFDPKYTQKHVKFPAKLMVWGCFNYRGVGKIIVLPRNQTMNKERYLLNLEEHLYDCFRMCKVRLDRGIFMQDGASCHTAKIIKEYFSFVNINHIEKWPGNSPDLNPIENLWSILKRQVRERDTSTIPKLEAAIYDAWRNIDKNILRNLASSLPKRLRMVIARKGYPIKY